MNYKMFSLVVMFAFFLGANVSNAQISEDCVAEISAAVDAVDAAQDGVWSTPKGLDRQVSKLTFVCTNPLVPLTTDAIIDKMIVIVDNALAGISKGVCETPEIPEAATIALTDLRTLLVEGCTVEL